MREKVNSFFNSRVFRLVFSLLVAIALWLYVEYSENEDIESVPIRVEVDFLNPEMVSDKNLVISEKRTTEVTLVYSGKRASISKLYASGAISVTADFADIKSAGLNMLRPTITFANGINQNDYKRVSTSDDYVIVYVENAFKKEVPVTALVEGQLAADGYQAEMPIFAPEMITITGLRAEVDRVVSARVNIQRENLTKTLITEMDFSLIDADGKVVESELITADRDKIAVTIPILMIKEIPLIVNLIPGAGATDKNTSVTISPETITVSGDPELLGTLNSIALTTIDLTLFGDYYMTNAPIILSNDITNVTGVTDAEITVSIRGLETKKFSVPLQNIQFINETPGYVSTSLTTELEVTVRGTEAELALLTEDNIRVIVDMSDFGDAAGAYSPPVRVRIDGDGATSCGAIGTYKVIALVTQEGITP